MKKRIKQLFIVSLPRSGSTLLQRILMGHSKISSIAEPWLLLPFLYATKNGVISEYSHRTTKIGITDVINNLPEQQNDFFKFVGDFTNKIYTSLSKPGDVYFLDKTPRYILIIPEIAKIFPEAKYIFLFRNPVQIFSSMISINTNIKSRFKTFNGNMFYKDLVRGPDLISNGYALLKEKSYGIQYEKFLTDPQRYIKEIMDYLELDFEPNMISDFYRQELRGRNGDVIGRNLYNKIEPSVLNKWKEIFNTHYRKFVVLKYVKSISEKTLSIQGYNKSNIIQEINQLKTNGKYPLIRDFVDFNIVKFRNKYNMLHFK